MKFALVGEERKEAQPGLDATCSVCMASLVAKCGHVRVWHWSHRAVRNCDHWWEPETEWHRSWKNQFPVDWQEVIQYAEDGEKHVADVRTAAGVVIEFQHSGLRREERQSRETFYKRIVWVVDGLRRKRDRPSFFASLIRSQIFSLKPLTYLLYPDENAILSEWSGSSVPVFLDFGEDIEQENMQRFSVPVLWRLDPVKSRNGAYLTPVRKDSFAAAYIGGLPLKGFDRTSALTQRARARFDFQHGARQVSGTNSFEQYLARRDAVRRRSRF